jgi:hypothetical protein
MSAQEQLVGAEEPYSIEIVFRDLIYLGLPTQRARKQIGNQ